MDALAFDIGEVRWTGTGRMMDRWVGDLRLDRTWDVDRGLPSDHAEFLLAVFDHVEFDRYDTRDLDGTAEGDFTVTLCDQNN